MVLARNVDGMTGPAGGRNAVMDGGRKAALKVKFYAPFGP
jgi:hypothetical protein